MAAASAAASAAAQKRASDKAANIQSDIANMNVDLQKEFAQTGVRWKVADAKAAGIHPLAALGAQTQGFNPVSVLSDPTSPYADSLGKMGQNISESWMRTADPNERQIATMKIEEQRLRNEQIGLQNQGLRKELNTLNTTPAFPSPDTNPWNLPGQGDTSYGGTNNEPGYRIKPDDLPFQQKKGVSSGLRPGTDQYGYPTQDPFIANYPNEKLAESLESGSYVDRWKHEAVVAQQAWRNFNNYMHPGGGNAQSAAEWRQWLREQQPASEPGRIMLWDGMLQGWRDVESYEGDTRLFYDSADQYPFRQHYAIER
jgi:hypothetical protein